MREVAMNQLDLLLLLLLLFFLVCPAWFLVKIASHNTRRENTGIDCKKKKEMMRRRRERGRG